MDIGRMLGESNLALANAMRDFESRQAEKARREGDRHDAIVGVHELGLANLASEFCKRIFEQIQQFDAALDQEHEVGVRLVTFGQAITFHATNLGYYNPSMMVFEGTLESGDPVCLMQHVSQISFLLMKLKRPNPEEPKKPFGFAAGRPQTATNEGDAPDPAAG